MHMLTASNTSKTAKIIKGDLSNVLVVLAVIFAVFDVLLAVNMCINYSFYRASAYCC